MITILAICFIMAILLHGFICHVIKIGTTVTKFLFVGCAIGIFIIWYNFKVYGFNLEFFAVVLTYGFLCELYIFLFTFIASSISVSILTRLNAGENDFNVLSNNYSGKVMVANRIRRLEELSMLFTQDNALQISKKGECLVINFNRLRNFFRLTPCIT